MRYIVILAVVISFVTDVWAQSHQLPTAPDEKGAVRSVLVKHSTDAIVIDGVLDEDHWLRAESAQDFHQYFPSDTAMAVYGTKIYFVTTDKSLLIGVHCTSSSDDYIVPTLRRDYRAGGNDNVTIMIDSYNDGNNAFMFGVNPLGVIREGLISGGGSTLAGFSTAWDNKWVGESTIGDSSWTAELEIPWTTLRYAEGSDRWRWNAYRFDMAGNERTTWTRIPRDQRIFNLAFMGDMIFEKPPQRTGSNISLIPYVNTSAAQLSLPESSDISVKAAAGIDAKIGITSGLNLDLSINPDFSQVEVDQQVTNLSRFELFFPERRQFFLENSDLFGSFGRRDINPFFSRRIGIATDTVRDQTIQTPVQYGVRLSGKLDENWRIGLLNAQTKSAPRLGISSTNYSVVTVQRKVLARSLVSAILTHQNLTSEKASDDLLERNTVAGLQFTYQSVDNRWNGTAYAFKSFTPETENKDFAHALRLRYSTLLYQIEVEQSRVGEDFEAAMGFVPRKDLQRLDMSGVRAWYPTSDKTNRIQLFLNGSYFYEPGGSRTDHVYSIGVEQAFLSNASIGIQFFDEFVRLRSDFNPLGDDGDQLQEGEAFNFRYMRLYFTSDPRRVISFRFNPIIGQFYNGRRYGVSGRAQLRLQPKVGVGVNYSVNHISLPGDSGERTLILVGPRVDVTLRKDLFLTGFFQYNNQVENFNVNTRLQWRFAPVSDLFIVYTNNYTTEGSWQATDRNLTIKLSYWLNL